VYLIYVDDCGKPEKIHRNNKFFCLSAVIIYDQKWHPIDKQIVYLKEKCSIQEIHSRNIYMMDKEFIGFRNFPSARFVVLNDIFNLISSLPITLVSSVIDKEKYFQQYDDEQVEFRGWKHLVERCEMGIGDLSYEGGSYQNGLIITDHNTSDAHDEIIRSFLQLIRLKGTGYLTINHLIEEPLFVVSKFRNLIQLADAVAYCTVKYLLGDQFFVSQFEKIKPRFRHNLTGDITNYGLKIFPE
jgi:hypothetical protein